MGKRVYTERRIEKYTNQPKWTGSMFAGAFAWKRPNIHAYVCVLRMSIRINKATDKTHSITQCHRRRSFCVFNGLCVDIGNNKTPKLSEILFFLSISHSAVSTPERLSLISLRWCLISTFGNQLMTNIKGVSCIVNHSRTQNSRQINGRHLLAENKAILIACVFHTYSQAKKCKRNHCLLITVRFIDK